MTRWSTFVIRNVMANRGVWPRWNRGTWQITASFLITLLTIDLIFVIVHVLRILLTEQGPGESSLLEDSRLSLGADRGYGEWYGYAKLIFCVVALVILTIRRAGPAYAAWALVLLIVLIDDSLLLHETFGGEIAKRLNLAPAFGLRAQDLGELLAWAIVSLALLVVLVTMHRRSSLDVRRDSRGLAVLIVVLGFFGVAVDMLQIEATGAGWLSHLAGLVEDGGELVVISMLAAFVVGLMSASASSVRRSDAGRGGPDPSAASFG